ncbi:hypothetical protein MYSTI_07878 [Myxococcus stipitatus DSM 14675]|uniref:Uncharacterized protein n=1 Tax=Myxococcus stipitatus (strain DSM 14675 / JCM 12634 / Mx s8) TaxID=1278073 RepID=L7UMN7_MYXSD|nr:hypothetical protein MYSTI_07878 [Myxococcus stipitatus DSM 14675]
MTCTTLMGRHHRPRVANTSVGSARRSASGSQQLRGPPLPHFIKVPWAIHQAVALRMRSGEGIMDINLNGTFHFKHVYATNLEDWGVLAFPQSQNATEVGRRYRVGEPVLLAIPQKPKEVAGPVPVEVRGRVFAVCTLVVLAGSATCQIANPEMVRRHPDVVKQWDTALPIRRLWRLSHPRPYIEFGQELVETARIRRGQLIRLADPLPAAEVRHWLGSVQCEELRLSYSTKVKALLDRFGRGP